MLFRSRRGRDEEDEEDEEEDDDDDEATTTDCECPSIAAADALATIAQRFSAGGASRESYHANVVTTASVSAAIAALSSTSIECICAGLRLSAACGLALPALTSAATAALSSNLAPAVGVAFDDGEFSFDQPNGSGKSDSSAAAAAIFSRLVLRKMPDIAAKPAHGRALDVARATLAALAGEIGRAHV